MKAKKCFNCGSGDGVMFNSFCRDCWRMAIIMAAFGGTGSEAFHQLIGMLFP